MKTRYTAPELTTVSFVVERGFTNSDKVNMTPPPETSGYNSNGQQTFETESGYFGGNNSWTNN
jgi:hypothetical protein